MIEVYVGIGSNAGRKKNIRKAVFELQQTFGDLTISSVYESAAVGCAQGRFYNLVVGFSLSLSLQQLQQRLRHIEVFCGRQRSIPSNGYFPLDLDILVYGDYIGKVCGIELPRCDIKRFAFVLCPLMEIAGTRCHPESGEPYQLLWNHFDKMSHPLKRVDLQLTEECEQPPFTPKLECVSVETGLAAARTDRW